MSHGIDVHGAPSGAAPSLLVGRDDLVKHLVTGLANPVGPHLAVFGDSGYGKTALVRRVVADLREHAYVVALQALAQPRNVAYAALSNVLLDLPPVEADGPLAVARAVMAHWAGAQGPRPCIVWVDDAHDIDEASAVVLSRLALAGKVRLVLSGRPAPDLPPALAAVVADETAERVELTRLGELEVAELLEAVLGAPTTLGATRQILRASGGNPQYVRELVRDALRSGQLVEHDGRWAWRGTDAEPGQHLRGLVASHLAAQPAWHREAVEFVAMSEPVAVPVLLGLVPSGVLDALEREHLVVIDGHSPPTVRLAHPTYGDAVRSLMPTGRRVELRRRMVAALEHATDDSLLALMRSVGWALDCGIDVEPERLVRAAELANRSHDYVFAARAARALLGSDVGHRARLALAFAYRFMGRVTDAVTVLEAGTPANADERIDLLLDRATVQQYALDKVTEAMTCLDDAHAAAPNAQRGQAIRARRFVHSLYGGIGDVHRDEGEALFADADLPAGLRVEITPAVALLRALSGRTDDALAVLQARVNAVSADERRATWAAEELIYMTVAISLLSGVLPTIGEAAGQELAAVDPTVRFDPGMEELALGWYELNSGRMSSASAQLGAAVSSFAANDPSGFKGFALALASEAAAAAGDHERALTLAGECRSIALRCSRMLAGQIDRALLWPSAVAHGFGRSIADAHLLADAVLRRGEVATAAHVLHDAIRLGDDSAARGAAELAGRCDGPRLHACHLHAMGLVRADGPLLAEAAEAFAASSLHLHAAECWSDAAVAFRRAGRLESARRASAAATVLVAGLGPVSTPRLMRSAGTRSLTRREVEIAALAARHLTNAEIAQALGLGRRTVEGHLHRAYGKLGVSNRDELAAVLG